MVLEIARTAGTRMIVNAAKCAKLNSQYKIEKPIESVAANAPSMSTPRAFATFTTTIGDHEICL
jgi:hypothetical protein